MSISDGSVHLNHGGTEMGQGLFTKVAQVVAEEFGIGLERVRITATITAKVPNTSPTAASSGTDLNGMAAQIAAATIKERLVAVCRRAPGTCRRKWSNSATTRCSSATRAIPFGELARKAYGARIHLSAAGFYKTPKIHWDRAKGKGRPFLYFAYGAACCEVIVDVTDRRDESRARRHPA